MPIYISRGRFTSDAVKGMVAKPENREEAVSKLFESVGVPPERQQRPSGAPDAHRFGGALAKQKKDRDRRLVSSASKKAPNASSTGRRRAQRPLASMRRSKKQLGY